jgi:hypothetical protein
MTETISTIDEGQDDQVYRMRLAGTSPRKIAEHFAISIAEVNRIVDRQMVKVDNGFRLRAVALDLERLEEMQMRFLRQALAGDAAAGHLVLKIQERRAAMLGTDAPVRIDPVQLVDAHGPHPTSTDRLRSAIERLTGPTAPSRQQ